MLKKLRYKFILVIMLTVTLLLAAAFIGIYGATVRTMERDARLALDVAVSNGITIIPSDQAARITARPMLYIQLDENGYIVREINQIYSLTEDDVITVVKLALQKSKTTGSLTEYSLRYIVARQPSGTIRLAFVDYSTQRSVVKTLLINAAFVGVTTLALFFIISLFLSHWVVRPVEKAWNSQKRFIADASHELRTPLTVILSNVSMLSQDESLSDTKSRARLENISEESKRMRGLVDEMLTIARSDDGTSAGAFEPVNLSNVLNQEVLMFEPVFFDKNKRFEYTVEDNLMVSGNQAKLRQLVQILLDNACKHSLEGGRVSVLLSRAAKSELVFEVSNDSETIPPDELTRLFERFYRRDKSRSSPGYGLGLSIAESIVREHGGKITAKSENNRTTFRVTLPAEK